MSVFSHLAFAFLLLALIACPEHAGANSGIHKGAALKSTQTYNHHAEAGSQTMALCIALKTLASRRASGMAGIPRSTSAACHKCQAECRSFSATHGLSDLCQC